jgi:hypothetical protein
VQICSIENHLVYPPGKNGLAFECSITSAFGLFVAPGRFKATLHCGELLPRHSPPPPASCGSQARRVKLHPTFYFWNISRSREKKNLSLSSSDGDSLTTIAPHCWFVCWLVAFLCRLNIQI